MSIAQRIHKKGFGAPKVDHDLSALMSRVLDSYELATSNARFFGPSKVGVMTGMVSDGRVKLKALEELNTNPLTRFFQRVFPKTVLGPAKAEEFEAKWKKNQWKLIREQISATENWSNAVNDFESAFRSFVILKVPLDAASPKSWSQRFAGFCRPKGRQLRGLRIKDAPCAPPNPRVPCTFILETNLQSWQPISF